ncbi:methyl-accepting chemotaxis protein [Paenibacillus sp. D2_2]|uniref:methyl-accepting chemotaxis protein n=1 Tax=Paenibacillus sp. D2_2 TaxID=3073092 RepID=UPI002815E1EF|nr:methyl-accepting chemotaxis protein [Paenibacillus sp. D2_2]WMT41072.1 methyl-accepting chemotaxis protein [Paenibacillus sp. D2_2]
MSALDKLSHGDFSVQLKTDESELGQVNAKFNATVRNMNELVATIKTVSTQSADQSKILFETLETNHQSSMAISDNIEEISEKASQQSKSISESVTSLEEINSGVGTIANSTSALSDASMQMKDNSEVGRDNISGVIKQMDSIQQSVQQSVVSIEQLQRRSGKLRRLYR